MTEGITSALLVAGVLGIWFPTTRGLSIAAVAALAFIYQWLAIVILIGCAAAVYFFRFRK